MAVAVVVKLLSAKILATAGGVDVRSVDGINVG
jgi:hypothetical protein